MDGKSHNDAREVRMVGERWKKGGKGRGSKGGKKGIFGIAEVTLEKVRFVFKVSHNFFLKWKFPPKYETYSSGQQNDFFHPLPFPNWIWATVRDDLPPSLQDEKCQSASGILLPLTHHSQKKKLLPFLSTLKANRPWGGGGEMEEEKQLATVNFG